MKDGIVTACSRVGGDVDGNCIAFLRWTAEDGRKLKKHLELEFEQKHNTQIYWDDIVMFCHSQEYQLGIFEMQPDDVIEIDSLEELISIDNNYVEI